jgi:hypothetical protein
MTYDNDPPRLRLSGDRTDPYFVALEEAHHELPDADQLKAVAAQLPFFDTVNSRPTHFSIGRTRLRVKSFQAAALALAVAFGVGASMLMRESLPFIGRLAPQKVVKVEPALPQPAMVTHPFAAPAPRTEEAPAPTAAPVVAPARAPSAHHAVAPPSADRPNQADLPASDLDGPSPEAETALLVRAHQMLSTDPSRALALTAQHRRVYPGGALGQESDLIAVEALVGLGRLSEARAAAATFRTRYPSSAHLRRLDRLLGEPEGATSPSSGH